MNEAKQKAMQDAVDAAEAVLRGAKLKATATEVDEWSIRGEDGRALRKALRNIGPAPDEKPKRSPQVGEFWKTDWGIVVIVAADPVPRQWFDGVHVRAADGRLKEFPTAKMTFVAKARKEGEFKVGDVVTFAGLEWRVASEEPEKIVGDYHLRLVAQYRERLETVWVKKASVSLFVPVEMKG